MLVRDFSSKVGFTDVWVYQGVGNMKIFMQVFKQKTKYVFIKEWHSRLENTSSARFYSVICNFQYQKYLDVLQIKKV